MMTSNNQTIFGMQNKAERYSWAAYHIFVLLSSLIGDTLILYASFQERVFRLNKFIVIVIQYIAVADLAYAIFSVFPGAVSLIADSWVLGDVMCYFRVYSGFFIYPGGMSLIAVMTVSKFLLLKYPVRCSRLTKRMAHQICWLVFIPPLAFPILFLVVDKDDVRFDYIPYTCTYGFRANVWKEIEPIISFITLFLPIIAIIASTIPTLKYLVDARKCARRAQGNVPWQGALTVAVTAFVFCISTLPNFVLKISRHFVKDDPTGLFQFHFPRINEYMLMINIMSNFYIYTLTVRSFRRFLMSKICLISPASSDLTATGESRNAKNSIKMSDKIPKVSEISEKRRKTQMDHSN